MRKAFVGIDGEGMESDKGHIYTLLASSTGEFIEDYEHGLSTLSCLEFLLSLRKHESILVAFACTYDVTMIHKDFDSYQHRMLASTGVVYLHLASGFAYRIEHKPGKYYRVSWGVRYYSKKRERMHWVTLAGRTVTVYDVWGFFQASFVVSLITWNIGAHALKEIADMKKLRGSFDESFRERTRNYCISECTMLTELMDKLRDRLESCGLHLIHWHGAGAIASSILRKEKATPYFPKTRANCCLGSYFGGRIQAVRLGTFEDVYTYDIRSAYPAIMRTLPAFKNVEPERVDDLGPYDIALCRFEHNGLFGPLPYRLPDESINYYSNALGYYHAAEIRAAVYAGASVELLEIWRLPYDDSVRPFAFIDEYYNRRAELRKRGDYAHICIKLGLNSLYGKTAQRVGGYGKPPTFQSIWIAGYITAGCRAMLLRAASESPENIIMFATDGIASTARLNLPLGSELGLWDEGHVDELRIYQPGMYYLREGSDVKVKTRSVATSKLQWTGMDEHAPDNERSARFFDKLKEIWDEQGIDGVLPIQVRQFISYRRELKLHARGSWIETPKQIGFQPSKGLPETRKGSIIRLRPESNPTPDVCSTLYSLEE